MFIVLPPKENRLKPRRGGMELCGLAHAAPLRSAEKSPEKVCILRPPTIHSSYGNRNLQSLV